MAEVLLPNKYVLAVRNREKIQVLIRSQMKANGREYCPMWMKV